MSIIPRLSVSQISLQGDVKTPRCRMATSPDEVREGLPEAPLNARQNKHPSLIYDRKD